LSDQAKLAACISPGAAQDATVVAQANTGGWVSVEEIQRMARRRFQDPTPKRHRKWWTILVRKDEFVDGKLVRKLKRVRLLPLVRQDGRKVGEREAKRAASEYLRDVNQGLETPAAAITFGDYVEKTYIPVVLPLMAKSSRDRSEGILENYLLPVFGKLCLRDLDGRKLQQYFSGPTLVSLSHESRDKIRDVLSSVLGSAVKYGLLLRNHAQAVKVPPDRRGKRRPKPYLTPAQFDELLILIEEPYASMVFVAVWTGLRVSELAALKWEDIGEDSITIDERFCRGDWGAPKSEASNATIGVNPEVIARIHRLKFLTVEGNAGGNNAVRTYKVVKSDGPTDLVFQSLRTGAPLRDNNILTRHIKPAARKMGLPWVNWRCLRTSHAVWLKMAGADVKDAQAQMRHSRASTTLDIYMQFVPESQRRVVNRLSSLRRVQ